VRISVFLATAATAFLAFSAAAYPLAFSKLGASRDEFRHDQIACERASTRTEYREQMAMRPPEPMKKLVIVHSKTGFLQCMSAHGYHEDRDGFETGPVWRFSKSEGQPLNIVDK